MTKRKKPKWISQKDWDDLDIPELTKEDFMHMRPMHELHPKLVAKLAKGKKRRGRPPGRTKKVVSIGLDKDILASLRAGSGGWQSRINELLRSALSLSQRGR